MYNVAYLKQSFIFTTLIRDVHGSPDLIEIMIDRKYLSIVEHKLSHFSAVGLLGPRQIGKTTLAHVIAETRDTIYLDLESPQDLLKLEDPVAYLSSHADKLIILDEIQRKPDLFMILRGLIDEGRRSGHKVGQFLILGSASLDLLRQSSESLAGRITYVEMSPLSVIEVGNTKESLKKLWLRGGFPDSYLASSDAVSIEWRMAFIKTYLERDVPLFSLRIPAETLRRLWTMLAHLQGTPVNAARLASSLGITSPTAARYIDLLVDLFLVHRLAPWYENVGKRQVKSPKIYVRDSGVLHALLNINRYDDLMGHPVVGASWEGFAIDNLVSFLPVGAETHYYRTARGAEIDLLVRLPDRRVVAIEIKRSSAPKPERGFYEACKDVNPTHRYVVYPGEEQFSLSHGVYAIGLYALIKELAD